ncbi:DNA-directed RNA polymerase subunit A' [Candidatus Micrarchaeota archaeon]|nr:DNA-directed RNA polymerase subunit A' [Candidatus Micrarchaeota archaeon]
MKEVTKIIDKIRFSLLSPEIVRDIAVAKITIPDTYDDDGYPIDGGLVDQRLGVIDPGLRCKTCGGKIKTCPGHFGMIELVRPIIHVEFGKTIYTILSTTCPECHTIISKTAKKCPNCKAKIPEIKFLKPTTIFKDGAAMLPTEVRDWLVSIPDSTLMKMGLDPRYARPEWMIISVLLVPPVSVRPSITLESGERSEDDLTHKLVDIIRINQKLEANINAGAPQLIIEDLWELLQYHITTYFDNETANIPPARHRSGRPLKTLAQRLKGKEGRFRYNLLGKRVNFSARTVISPDPMIRLDEVGVPLKMAEELTIPVTVTDWNIDECKRHISSESYPQALYVIRNDGRRIRVTDITKEEVLKELKIGWIIERQIVDGDIAIFNRQPSLHRVSMMGHEIRVLPGKTFRLNPITTTPYNADFDGDEMNLHIIQTPDAQAEVRELMKVENQIISPRHGHAIIKPTEDHVSAAYFLTRDDAVFTRKEASKLLIIANIKKLPKPDKGDKYSGKLLFSLLLPSELSLKEKTKLGDIVEIKKGKMIKGALDNRVLEGGLLERFFLIKGPKATRDFLDAITKISLEALRWTGLSVSLKNYSLSPAALKTVEGIENKANREMENLILQYKNKTLERSPGLTLKETLEFNIMAVTTRTRNEAGKIVEDDLGQTNSSIIMAKIGARGSLLNAIQMSALVGQQAVRNKRLKRGYIQRSLPFYKKGSLKGKERGFVYNSFRKGLTPDEFFHHAMGGRESLVNTAIRTARSGYMQRRLIHALQDLTVQEDRTVKNGKDAIVQFMYGGDGKDPMYETTTEYMESAKEDAVDTV